MLKELRTHAHGFNINDYRHAIHVKNKAPVHHSTTDLHSTSYLLSHNPKVGIEYFKTAMAKEKRMNKLLQIHRELNEWRAKALKDVDALWKELKEKRKTLNTSEYHTRIVPLDRVIKNIKGAKAMLTDID